MKKLIPKPIKKMLREFYNNKLDVYATKSYSQEGEDMILRKIFEFDATGFYVDVGAHHPMRFSNTYYFYKKGWTGINIDARPGIKKQFAALRPRDITVEAGVSLEKCQQTYYMFNEPAFNTFDSALAVEQSNEKCYIVNKQIIDCLSLAEILDKYVPPTQRISFMTIDVEGFDLQVLQSNNWQKYRPKLIVIETHKIYIDEVVNGDILNYLTKLGYRLFSKLYYSLIFKDSEL